MTTDTTGRRVIAARDVTGIQDRAVYREACAVFGEEGARAWLQVFREDLAGHLAEIAHGRPTRAVVRDIAHRTAGRAGLFGFRALGDASARLEESLRLDDGVAAARDHWTRQARLALAAASTAGAPPMPDTRDRPPRD